MKAIFFDCMETLIDMKQIPTAREYALWAFEHSLAELYWDFPSFFQDYLEMRSYLAQKPPLYREYELHLRYRYLLEKKVKNGKILAKDVDSISASMFTCFWERYKKKCYAADSVRTTLELLKDKYRLAVVSNFLVWDGVEQLLHLTGLAECLEFVVTSVKTGWRKPHEKIYSEALASAGLAAKEVLFIGDDWQCDYAQPQAMGFQTLFYDKRDAKPASLRIRDFTEIPALAERY